MPDTSNKPAQEKSAHVLAAPPDPRFEVPLEPATSAMTFRARRFNFHFPRPVMVMGVVNVTPDSFSDGGEFLDPDAAVSRAKEMIQQGAEWIDVGGESSRPGAQPVGETEELRRVLPVIESLASQVQVPISVDTRKLTVARAALEAGASIVNDIAANREDSSLWRAVAEADAGYICMHMQGTPLTMQRNPTYHDVVAEVQAFWEDRLGRLRDAGVSRDQVVLDPGIGFGKTLEHNLQLLRAWPRLTTLNRPTLLGVSRKSFLSRWSGAGISTRLPAALACSCWGVHAGVHILRTHDVAETLRAVRMTESILAQD